MRAVFRKVGQEPLAAKVPEVTAVFWLIKLLTTYMGEALSDYFGGNVVVGGAVEVALLGVALYFQFRTRRYVAAAYWGLAMAIATIGTGAADAVHVVLGLPYPLTTVLYGALLAAIFWRWYATEGTLSIHSITTRRRERYYWATVFATFALGTATGDLTATNFNLGFFDSGLLFIAAILVPLVAWWRFGLGEVVAFWWAYVLTRPLGASFADYVSKAPSISGIGFGNLPTALTALGAIAGLVAWVSVARNDIQEPTLLAGEAA